MKVGDVVIIGYTVYASDEKGEKLVDTTYEEEAKKAGIYDPSKRYGDLAVIYGRGNLLETVEEVLATMNPGEVRETIIPPEKAYGQRREDLVVRVPLKQLERMGIPARIGAEVEIANRRGVITRVTERFAYIDFNHPLAGKTLRVKLELKRVVEDPIEKVKLLVARALGLSEDVIQAFVEGGTVKVKLPVSIMNLNDLDARLRLLIVYIKDSLDPEKLELIVDVYYKKSEGGTQEQKSETQSKAQEGST
ncbi:MAG: peptidylprolyl isomerase [Acidilobaceae archaeon]